MKNNQPKCSLCSMAGLLVLFEAELRELGLVELAFDLARLLEARVRVDEADRAPPLHGHALDVPARGAVRRPARDLPDDARRHAALAECRPPAQGRRLRDAQPLLDRPPARPKGTGKQGKE